MSSNTKSILCNKEVERQWALLNQEGAQPGNQSLGDIKSIRPRVRFKHHGISHDAQAGSQDPDGRDMDIVRIVSWNTHNIDLFRNRQKLSGLGANVLLLQEVNRSMLGMQTALGYKWVYKERNDKLLAIAMPTNIVYRRQEEMETHNSLVVELIFGGRFSIFVGTIHQTTVRQEYGILLDKMQMHPFILGGDLNRVIGRKGTRNYAVVEEIKDRRILKNKKLETNQQLSEQKKIDYIFLQNTIRFDREPLVQFYNIDFNPSDHRPLRVKVQMPKRTGMYFPFYDQKRIGGYLLDQKIWEVDDVWGLIEKCENIPKEVKVVKFKIPKYVEWDMDFQMRLENKRQYDSKAYYNFVKHTAKVGKQLSGQIVNAMMIEDYVETDYKKITSKAIQQLIRVQRQLGEEERWNRKWKRITKLEYKDVDDSVTLKIPEFELEHLEMLKERRRQGKGKYIKGNKLGDRYKVYKKAVSVDWTRLSDIIPIWNKFTDGIKSMRKQDIELNLLDVERLRNTKYTLEMRLVPINKAHPNIPNEEQIRPICVQSHVVKLLEMFYTEGLQRLMKYEIGNDQVGFVPGLGTQINLWQVVEYARNKAPQKQMIFVDLSNAYNTVNRELLFEIIMRRKWMDEKSASFLMTLYDEMYFWDPVSQKRIYLKNGLHQGSMIAPMLFNLYFSEMMREWRTRIYLMALGFGSKNRKRIQRQMNETKTLAYADDIVILTNGGTSRKIIDILLQVLEEYDMRINIKKTQYMANKSDKLLEQIGINKVETYRYLGVWINTRGTISAHYTKLKGIILKNSWRLRILDSVLPLRHVAKLWTAFIKPHFDYISLLLWDQSHSVIKKFDTLWRKSIKVICGLHKSYNVKVIEDLFGYLPFYGGPKQYLENQWRLFMKRNMWKDFKQQYMQNMGDTDWQGFKDLEIMQKTITHGQYETLNESGWSKTITLYQMKRFILWTQRMENKLEDKLQQYRQKHIKYFEKLGKEPGKKMESNRIRKVPDRQYFDIWRFSCVGCKVHEGKYFDEEHLMTHIEEQRLGDKHVKQIQEIKKWVMSEALFSKKRAKLKNDEMHYLSNKIRKIIEVLGVFRKKQKEK